jgi:hypothetical protein
MKFVKRMIQRVLKNRNPDRFMKTATLLRVGEGNLAARWFGLLAITGLLLGAVSLQAQSSSATKTIVTSLGGGPQSYNPSSYFGYSNSVTFESQFHTPSGLAMDNFQDYLYVADRDNNAIRLIDLSVSPSETYTFAPYPPYVPTNLISQPVGVAVDALSDVFVLNRGKGTNGTVVEFDYLGDLIATNTTRLTNASGIALDSVGDIFVTASNTVFKITPAGVSNVVVTITNAGASLQGIVVKRSGPTAGLLAVCDSGRNGIYLINPTSGAVTTNAGFNGVGDGTGNRNQGVLNTHAQFFQPSGLAEAGDGSLIVADFGNQRVKLVTVLGITTNLYGVASNLWWKGTTANGRVVNYGWSDGNVWEPDTAGDVQARMPFGVTIDSDGNVYTTEDYYHIIREVTGANIQVPPPLPPPPPTGLAVSPSPLNNYGQVVLTWNASSGATNYNIKRSTTSGAETTIASTAGTSYTDTNVFDGTTYYYVVSALNTGGEGLNSTEVSATPLFSPAPANLIVVTTNFGLVSLAWSTSVGATSYNLKRAPSHGGPYTTIVNTASTSYNDNNVVDGTTYYYVVTAVNAGGENPANSSEVSATPPLPPVPNPQIGWVTFPPTAFTSVFNVGSQSGNTFNNDVPIVIIGAAGSQSYYTYTNTMIVTNVPDPTSTSASAPVGYVDGLPSSSVVGLTVAQILPNLAIKAIGEQSGHPNSAVVSALFQFVVGNPIIFGNNAAQFTVTNITLGAQMWYTLDGTDPTNAAPSIGPITTGQTLSLNFGNSTNLLFKIRGFKVNYQPSGIVSNLFSIANFLPNAISFGFASGEASSDFVASPGQTFYAPVTLTTLPAAVMYSLQFNVTVNTGPTNPGPALGGPPAPFNFQSMLMKPVPGVTPVIYTPILPEMFVNGGFTNLVFTNLSENLLGVGWVERAGATNLYDTTKQTLITYSLAHDDLFPNPAQPNEVIVGGYSFQVPASATPGQTYQIQLGRPTATSDGIGAPGSSVFILAPTNGSLAGGAINAIKNVTLGNRKYIAGNSYPFRWFNAGDFGNTNLQNADVEQVFQSAIYGLNYPPPGSDFFDAMDSCGVTYVDNGFGYLQPNAPVANTSVLFDGNDTTINQIAFGDGVYVTYRRSLDTNLVWFNRFWTNDVAHGVSGRVAQITSNVFNPSLVTQPVGKLSPALTLNPGPVSITNTPTVNFVAGDFQATAGQAIQIPIAATVFGKYPLRVAMLNVSVVPLDGSPPLTTPITFNNGALGTPYTSYSIDQANYSAVWLNSAITGISNNATIGTLNITIPGNATSSSAYAVHFDHASGSPNGLASFPKHTLTGLITLSSRSTSSYNDGIPDSWRLRYFGTIYNLLSVSNADADGTGVNNWQKYIAGLDPTDPASKLTAGLDQPMAQSQQDSVIDWPSMSGKQYVIQRSAALFPAVWTPIYTNNGTGGYMEIHDSPTNKFRYYRVSVQ